MLVSFAHKDARLSISRDSYSARVRLTPRCYQGFRLVEICGLAEDWLWFKE